MDDRNLAPTNRRSRRARAGALAFAALFGIASSAGALTLGTPTASLDAGNTGNQLVDTITPPVTRIRTSSVSTLSSSATAFQVRYAMVVGTDIGNTGSITQNHTASYTISFTVNHDAGATWWLFVDTSRMGALTLVDDGNGSASANLSGVTGTAGGAGSLAGSLGVTGVGPLTGAAGGNTPFSQTSSAVITGTGTGANQVVTLSFTWTASATSTRQGNNGDEAAIRMGLAGNATSYTAGNYGGVGGRTLSADGHFVNVTLVPEPGTALLAAAGLAGLAVASRRRVRA